MSIEPITIPMSIEVNDVTIDSTIETNEVTIESTFDAKIEVVEGGDITVQSLTVTENGTATAPTGKAYSPVIVNVPNSYTNADEGKVVQNGALTSQTSTTKSANGTYDTTTNNQVTVSVPASAVDTGTKSISTNGTHDVVGYASAAVNVPNTYTASDEGKVVDNGVLVAQTSTTVTTNGTYDTTTNDEVVVNVSGGTPTLITKTITENGTYEASDDGADGYSEVTVNVSGGGSPTLYYNSASNGTLYAENTIIDSAMPISALKKLAGAANLKTVRCLKTSDYGGSSANSIASALLGCPLLEEVTFLNGISTSGYAEDLIKDCPNIKKFTTGDIGYPNTVGMGSASGNYKLFRNIAIAFDIIIYTTATSLATVPSVLTSGSPWGATNATVIYKNSVTGEVLT